MVRIVGTRPAARPWWCRRGRRHGAARGRRRRRGLRRRGGTQGCGHAAAGPSCAGRSADARGLCADRRRGGAGWRSRRERVGVRLDDPEADVDVAHEVGRTPRPARRSTVWHGGGAPPRRGRLGPTWPGRPWSVRWWDDAWARATRARWGCRPRGEGDVASGGWRTPRPRAREPLGVEALVLQVVLDRDRLEHLLHDRDEGLETPSPLAATRRERLAAPGIERRFNSASVSRSGRSRLLY